MQQRCTIGKRWCIACASLVHPWCPTRRARGTGRGARPGCPRVSGSWRAAGLGHDQVASTGGLDTGPPGSGCLYTIWCQLARRRERPALQRESDHHRSCCSCRVPSLRIASKQPPLRFCDRRQMAEDAWLPPGTCSRIESQRVAAAPQPPASLCIDAEADCPVPKPSMDATSPLSARAWFSVLVHTSVMPLADQRSLRKPKSQAPVFLLR